MVDQNPDMFGRLDFCEWVQCTVAIIVYLEITLDDLPNDLYR